MTSACTTLNNRTLHLLFESHYWYSSVWDLNYFRTFNHLELSLSLSLSYRLQTKDKTFQLIALHPSLKFSILSEVPLNKKTDPVISAGLYSEVALVRFLLLTDSQSNLTNLLKWWVSWGQWLAQSSLSQIWLIKALLKHIRKQT